MHASLKRRRTSTVRLHTLALLAGAVLAACLAAAARAAPAAAAEPLPAEDPPVVTALGADPAVVSAVGLEPAGPRLGVLTKTGIDRVKYRISRGVAPETAAWRYHRANRVTPALDDRPTPRSPGDVTTYAALDTDSRKARNVAVGYALSGTRSSASMVRRFLLAWSHPTTGGRPYVGSEQNAYHQAYGVFSFAFAYDLTAAAGVYTSADHTQIRAWFRRWADAMKVMMDRWSRDYYFTAGAADERSRYSWTSRLTRNTQDWYEGRDATLAPFAAWLAAVIVSDYDAHRSVLFDTHRLKVSTILHAATQPDNDGDGRGTRPAPDSNIGSSKQDYITYHCRLASVLYEMTRSQGRATSAMHAALQRSWSWIRSFTPPTTSPNGRQFTASLFFARVQTASHLFDMKNLRPSSNLYESQLLGPTILTQPRP
jgi:hypothetical protein